MTVMSVMVIPVMKVMMVAMTTSMKITMMIRDDLPPQETVEIANHPICFVLKQPRL